MSFSPVVRALLASTVDYAGLFPPASLPMEQAVANYLTYRRHKDPWMLGSFVVPVARVPELADCLAACDPHTAVPTSVLLGPQPHQTVEHVEPIRERYAGVLEIGSVEVGPLSSEEIPVLAAVLAEDLTVYFELEATGSAKHLLDRDVQSRLDNRLAAVADTGDCAKIRCGGVTPEAIPSVFDVARFVTACRERRVPFKATAGLHHAIRGPQPLTYEPDSDHAWMHGFVNLSMAAALLDAGSIDEAGVAEALSESSPSVFQLGVDEILWRDRSVDVDDIQRTRRSFFHCFGSCSYEEPIRELGDLFLS